MNGIRGERRERDLFMPKITPETRNVGVGGVFHVLGLDARILSYESFDLVHGWRFVRWFEGNSLAV